MEEVRRQELVERLLGILVEFIPFQLPEETRDALLEEPTGSWVIPDTIITTTAENNNILWKSPSLYWMWQEETGSCCVNFLAQEGFFPWGGTIEAFQWTLEASYYDDDNDNDVKGQTHKDVETEFRRFEPLVLTSDHHSSFPASSSSLRVTPVRSFWKIASLKILCVEFPVATLMGTLSSSSSSSRSSNNNRSWRLDPKAVFSCDKVALIEKLPATSNEHIQMAKVVRLLEAWHTPQAEWRSPPGCETTSESLVTVNSLADIFRRAYTFLEDEERRGLRSSGGTKGNESTTTTTTTTTSGIHRRIDIKKSITDSLIMTGGLVATGASFVTPVGAAVSVAAIGVKDGVAAAARKGQNSRGNKGDGTSTGYQFGDVTRGIVSSIQEKKSQRRRQEQQQQQQKTDEDNSSTDIASSSSNDRREDPSFLEANKGRYLGVVGSSLGAAVGLTLVGGPLGLLAGSLAGGVATQEAMRRQGDTHDLHPSDEALRRSTAARHPHSFTQHSSITSTDEEIMIQLEREGNAANEKKPWKFGDNIRNVVQRGKEASGRDPDAGYAPGDFSRGLFSRKK